MKTIEKTLPEGYNEDFHIDARNKKTGIILTVVSTFVVLLSVAVALLTVKETEIDFPEVLYIAALFIVIMIAYVVLHELVHGAVYKIMTKEKLTFGMSWSCAFCGVPNVYVYKRTSILSLMMPVTVFSAVFIALAAIFYSVSPALYIIFVILEGYNLGGASGDIFMLYILLFKYKGIETLMRDTGPEQWIYIIK